MTAMDWIKQNKAKVVTGAVLAFVALNGVFHWIPPGSLGGIDTIAAVLATLGLWVTPSPVVRTGPPPE